MLLPIEQSLEFLKSTNKQHRLAAAMALDSRSPLAPKAVPLLIKAMDEDRRPPQAKLYCVTLGAIGGPASNAAPELRKRIVDTTWPADVRAAMTEALTRVAPAQKASLDLFVGLLTNADPTLRSAALKGLSAAGLASRPTIPALTAVIPTLNDEQKAHAGGFLGKFAPKYADEVLPGLKLLLQSDHVIVLGAAFQGLKDLGLTTNAPTQEMLALLNRSTGQVKVQALEAIDLWGAQEPRLVEAVTQLSRDPNPAISNAATSALIRMKPAPPRK